jgi:hypothetical protein
MPWLRWAVPARKATAAGLMLDAESKTRQQMDSDTFKL